MLFEHGFKILQTSPELYAESAADLTDHLADAFVYKNVAYGCDVVMIL